MSQLVPAYLEWKHGRQRVDHGGVGGADVQVDLDGACAGEGTGRASDEGESVGEGECVYYFDVVAIHIHSACIRAVCFY